MTDAGTGTRWLSDNTGMIDLQFLGVPSVISAYVLRTGDGLALVECGPSTTLAALERGLDELGVDIRDIRHILVTHIHLDHAGAAGGLLQRLPEARFYVHEAGAPHMVDPTNLIRSATRIYADQMDVLWGEFLPCPTDRTTVLTDGDVLEIGGRELRVIYTPGHASHHVTFHDPSDDQALTGDVGGIRIPPSTLSLPPTPPPDIDVDAWHASIAAIRETDARRLLLTHFGPVEDVAPHLDQVDRRLDEIVTTVEGWVAEGLDRDAMVAQLTAQFQGALFEAGGQDVEQSLALATPYAMSIDGLTRFLRKRAEREAQPQ